MSYDTYRMIFIGGLVLSIVMLLATIAIFFLLRIKDVIGDLTGANARKEIADIRKQSVAAVPRKEKKKEKLVATAEPISESLMETAKISPQDRFDNLQASETTVLHVADDAQTTVLSEAPLAGETDEVLILASTPVNPNFIIEADITYIHSNEIVK